MNTTPNLTAELLTDTELDEIQGGGAVRDWFRQQGQAIKKDWNGVLDLVFLRKATEI